MAKKRVYEVAKEIGIPAKELLVRLKEAGIEAKSNFSTLDDDQVAQVSKLFANGGVATAAPEATAKPEVSEAVAEVETQPETVAEEKAEPEVETPEPTPEPVQAEAKPVAEDTTDDEEAELERLMAEEAASQQEVLAEVEQEVAVQTATMPRKKSTGTELRPPVVTILGHVDHGKTTLLDHIRQTRVVDGEAGGITQGIGAYQAVYKDQVITFIDTPGHAAFTNMRARGAQATDIVILVVAADDGVMAQTEEAINHAKAAGVPIIVAVNKIDKAPDRLDRVKQDLVQQELTPEDWGGDTITVPLSALNGQGVDDLLEMILLTAELQEYKADPKGPVEAVVIESHLDSQRGPITSILVRDGTLHNRDVVVVGNTHGRIKSLTDGHGKPLQSAGPSVPVQVLGLDAVPPAGAKLEVVDQLNVAKNQAADRREEERQVRLAPQRKTMTDLMSEMLIKGKLRLVLKADSAGALEVMESELKKIELEDISIDILHTGVGPVGESDVMLAASGEDAQAAVIGFRTTVDKTAASRAQQAGITLRTYNIIYELVQEVERALRRMVEPEFQEVKLAEIEVRDVFKIPRVGTVAGCFVRDGIVVRNSKIRVLRDGVEIHQGSMRNLKRFEEDAKQVEKGKECGILLEGFNDLQTGDLLENFKVEKVEI